MGAIWHVAAVSFEKEFGVELKHIPYPNGSADIAAALTGGHIDATIADPSSYKSQVDAGEMKILVLCQKNVPAFIQMFLLSKSRDMTVLSMALTEQLPVQPMFQMTFISIYVMNLQSFAAVMNLSRQ